MSSDGEGDGDGESFHPRAIQSWFFLPPHSGIHLELFLCLLPAPHLHTLHFLPWSVVPHYIQFYWEWCFRYIQYCPLFSVLSLKLVSCSFQGCTRSMASSWPLVSSLQPWGLHCRLVPGLSNLLILFHARLYAAFDLGVIHSSFYAQ